MTQLSRVGFTVFVRADPDLPAALVCLAGEIDLAAAGALSHAAAYLSAVAPAEVVVDLAEVTFACSTLTNFLGRLHRGAPTVASLTVCRASHSTRWVLQASGIDRIATLRVDLPETSWLTPPTSGALFVARTRNQNVDRY